MTSWSHLPNAEHIDRVIALSRKYPEIWADSYRISRDLKLDHRAGWDPAYNICQSDGLKHIRKDLWAVVSTDEQGTGELTAWHAISALMAWNDCAHMLDSDPNELSILAKLGNPMAILLIPACIAFSKINK